MQGQGEFYQLPPRRSGKIPAMTKSSRILVFDSGVGGLSILRAIRQRLPGQDYIYASDNNAFPYGVKSQDFLVQRVDSVLRALIKTEQPDIIVVACNTASTVALPIIRSHFSAPVVGVVPAIKPAAALSRTGVIGVLGTPATVERAYTQQLINDFASHCTVLKLGSSRLVDIAEQALRGRGANPEELKTILAPLFQVEQLDTIVLACTHFPLLADELAAIAPRPLCWVDSGDAIARRVASLLEKDQPESVKTVGQGAIKAIFTCSNPALAALRPALEHFTSEAVSVLEI